jgi:phytoene synthase
VQKLDPQAVVALPDLTKVCAPLLAEAQDHFVKADAIMAKRPRAEVRAPRIMSLAYGAIWRKLVARGFARPRTRIRTPKLVLVLALLRYGIF